MEKNYDKFRKNTVVKHRDITMTTKIHIVLTIILLAVTDSCESGTVRKVKSREMNNFEYLVKCFLDDSYSIWHKAMSGKSDYDLDLYTFWSEFIYLVIQLKLYGS